MSVKIKRLVRPLFLYLLVLNLFVLGGCNLNDFLSISDSGSDNNTAENENFELTVIHLNDIHSHLPEEEKSLYFDGTKTYVQMGGMPRVISKIKSLTETEPNPIVLNAGDMIVGTLYYVLFKGEATAKLLNFINWDAVILGNHEFDNGNEGLKSFLDKLNAPVVSANIIPQEGSILKGYWEPYRIIERQGEKIGIIGIGYSQKTKDSSNPGEDIDFLEEIETARQYVQELENQGVNKIIILSHFGMENDLLLAQEVDGVDVVIDGDSHSLLGDYSEYGLSSQYNQYPQIIEKADGTKVCVASAWQYAYAVGKLHVEFDKNGHVTDCSGVTTILLGDIFKQKDAEGKKVEVDEATRAHILDLIAQSGGKLEVVAPDETALEALSEYISQVEELKNKEIGEAAEFLGHNRIPGDKWDGVSYLPEHGSEIAPLVAKSFYEKVKDADLAIQNAGGVRTYIDQGPITIGEVYTLLPFSNTLFTLELTGAEIKQVLEDALANFEDNGGSTGSFPYAYGIRYKIDMSQPKNQRVYDLEIMNRETHEWSPINPDQTYKVVTNSYIAAGKDGYLTFGKVLEERGGTDTYFGYAETFIEMIEKLSSEGKKLEKLPREEMPVQRFTPNTMKLLSLISGSKASSEINVYDPQSKRLFITNGDENSLDIYDLSNVTAPNLIKSIDLANYGDGINSVAVKNGLVAVAEEVVDSTDDSKQLKGKVIFFDTEGNFKREVTVGYLPDMITFTPDGTKVLVANEGEPNDAYNYDPEGTVGIINLTNDYAYTELDFGGITLTPAKDGTPVRLGGTPTNDQAKDLEPEYIAVAGDYAFVTLQENNAVAKIDLNSNSISLVKSLGRKDYTPGHYTIDIEENGKIEMKNFAGLYGLYQPDGIATYEVNGTLFFITANEGDGRDYDGYSDEKKISKLNLDPSIASSYEEDNDLKVMTDLGDLDNDGEYEELYAFGGRSFSIWDANGDLVWDSGDEFSRIVAQKEPELFNHDEGEMDGRSGNKGVEPEGVVVGKIGDKFYAFIGLERQCSIMVYDITNPQNPQFVYYLPEFNKGNVAPEGLTFVPAEESPNGKPLLIVSFEESGTTAIYQINLGE
ncbi:NAD pyrophosphatase/5'-nucleotidase NadN [Thermodesulfatator indicus DSM 15286]|uniref:NAD pyrophosphatase/5'-nucleotidase NadN n=1 Tax=Thermodesulfatator indicus (strain DSM 15286 / JCM 11887 / CIR29812) TaxID=667014 RepID=F8ADB5_THEID|nr:NAD nucleotidase [Thermodesulfatator indicus]AEH45930.1 NAD pyrophosphatase/5'-nucleotidase NadN [Thermodesulfatator indicus DSM 15286]